MQITLLCTYLEHEGEGWRAFRLHFQRSRKKLRRELASYFEIASSPPSSSSSGKLIKLRLHQYFNNGLECAIHKFTSVSADDSSHPPFPFRLSFFLPFSSISFYFFVLFYFSFFFIFSFHFFFWFLYSFIIRSYLFSDSSFFFSLFISLFLTLFFFFLSFYFSLFSSFFIFFFSLFFSFVFFTLPLSFS